MVDKKANLMQDLLSRENEIVNILCELPIVIFYSSGGKNGVFSVSAICSSRKKINNNIDIFLDNIRGDKKVIRRLVYILSLLGENFTRERSSSGKTIFSSIIASLNINNTTHYTCAINIKPIKIISKNLYDFLTHLPDKNFTDLFLLFIQNKHRFGIIIIPVVSKKSKMFTNIINPLMSIYSNDHTTHIELINKKFIKQVISEILLMRNIKKFTSKITMENKPTIKKLLSDILTMHANILQRDHLSRDVKWNIPPQSNAMSKGISHEMSNAVFRLLLQENIEITMIQKHEQIFLNKKKTLDNFFTTSLIHVGNNLWILSDYFQKFEEFFIPEALFVSLSLKKKKKPQHSD